jgi:lysophospholipase L1-like esterase
LDEVRLARRLITMAGASGGVIAAWAMAEGLLDGKGIGPARAAAAVLGGGLAVLAWWSRRAVAGRGGGLIANLWLSATTGAASFIIFDLVAGALLVPRLSPPGLLDAVVHHRLVPDTVSEFRSPEYRYELHVNSLGLRGPKVELPRPNSTVIVLLLGDSFVMGKGVADDETFAALLQHRLRSVDGRRVEVLNGGVDSYAPILSYLQYRTQLSGAAADVVVLALDMSDPLQEQAYRRAAIFDDHGLPLAVPGSPGYRSPSQRLRDWLFDNTYVTRLLLHLARERMNDPQRPSIDEAVTVLNPDLLAHTLEGSAIDVASHWDAVFASAEATRELAVARGADFLLTVHPWGHQVNEREWVPGRWRFIPRDARVSDATLEVVRRRAAALRLSLVDLVPAFRAYTGSEPLFFEMDMHFRQAGHRLVADQLAHALAALPDLELRPEREGVEPWIVRERMNGYSGPGAASRSVALGAAGFRRT